MTPRSNCEDMDIDESGALVASPGSPNNNAANQVFPVTWDIQHSQIYPFRCKCFHGSN